MELQEKHRVTLLNAKCEVVCKVQSLLKKMEYGEDVSCCTRKLYAAILLINRLDCYCFPETTNETLTTGTETLSVNKTINKALGTYYLYSGNSIIATYELTTTGTLNDITVQLLNLAALPYTVNTAFETVNIYTITTDCDENTLIVRDSSSELATASLVTSPTCEVNVSECYNCIEDSDLNKMYEVLANLLK